MTGWLWCHGATGWCFVCKNLKHGVWRYWVSPTVSKHDVCADCAGGAGL